MDFYVVRKYIIILQLICVLFNKRQVFYHEKKIKICMRETFFSLEKMSLLNVRKQLFKESKTFSSTFQKCIGVSLK